MSRIPDKRRPTQTDAASYKSDDLVLSSSAERTATALDAAEQTLLAIRAVLEADHRGTVEIARLRMRQIKILANALTRTEGDLALALKRSRRTPAETSAAAPDQAAPADISSTFSAPDVAVTEYRVAWSEQEQAFVASIPLGIVPADTYQFLIGVGEHPIAALASLRELMAKVDALIGAKRADGKSVEGTD